MACRRPAGGGICIQRQEAVKCTCSRARAGLGTRRRQRRGGRHRSRRRRMDCLRGLVRAAPWRRARAVGRQERARRRGGPRGGRAGAPAAGVPAPLGWSTGGAPRRRPAGLALGAARRSERIWQRTARNCQRYDAGPNFCRLLRKRSGVLGPSSGRQEGLGGGGATSGASCKTISALPCHFLIVYCGSFFGREGQAPGPKHGASAGANGGSCDTRHAPAAAAKDTRRCGRQRARHGGGGEEIAAGRPARTCPLR